MPADYHTLRAKYPKWAHRRDDHRRRRRKRKRARRSRRKKKQSREKMGSTTEGMLMSLLHQLMLGGTLAKKHGENVVTGYADRVRPDALAPVRSRAEMRRMRAGPQQGFGAGAGAAAVIGGGGGGPPGPPPGPPGPPRVLRVQAPVPAALRRISHHLTGTCPAFLNPKRKGFPFF